MAIPLTPKPVPEMEIKEIARSALPVLEIVRFKLLVEPTPTVPNCIEVLLRDICGAEATAVAERFTVAGGAPSLPCRVRVPVKVPVAVGVTATVKFPVWPVATAIGSVTPVKLNTGLEDAAWVIETGIVPVFVTATVCVVCLPTPTFPKLTLVGFTWKAAWPVVVFVPFTKPAHPPRIPVPRSTADSRIELNFWRGLTGLCRTPIPMALAVPRVLIVFPSASFITLRGYEY